MASVETSSKIFTMSWPVIWSSCWPQPGGTRRTAWRGVEPSACAQVRDEMGHVSRGVATTDHSLGNFVEGQKDCPLWLLVQPAIPFCVPFCTNKIQQVGVVFHRQKVGLHKSAWTKGWVNKLSTWSCWHFVFTGSFSTVPVNNSGISSLVIR